MRGVWVLRLCVEAETLSHYGNVNWVKAAAKLGEETDSA